MASPFPGMDPYLESASRWFSFHGQYVIELARELVANLPPGYYADNEVMLFIHEPSARRRLLGRADDAVMIGGGGTPPPQGGTAQSAVATADRPSERVPMGEPVVTEKHRYIQVRTIKSDRIVTAIELLSPTNKERPGDREVYLAKRGELLRDGVNVVQIDLLRGGPRLLPVESPPHDYNAMAVRASEASEADVWYWSLRDSLKTLPIPLSEGDADVPLNLRAALDRVYDAMHYERLIYRRPPEPPLTGDDAAWAAALLKEAGIDAAA